MRTGGARILAVAGLAIGTPAAADPLQDQLVAGMKANGTADIAFTETARIERTGAAPATFVTRYDPRSPAGARWTLASVDGRAPTAKETTQVVKAANATPIPAYARLADWFARPATRIAQAPGSAGYRFVGLPPGTVKIGSHDASAQTIAEVLVDTRGPVPFVARVRFVSTRPFSMMLVARVERYAFTTSYAPLPDGRPFPAARESEMTGAIMGKHGSFVTRSRYAEMRAVR